uniref:Uncharacterized protein n=1 Tax=Syphacia muris TaxID=451379 RepID=A0A0N5AIY8_9BILA
MHFPKLTNYFVFIDYLLQMIDTLLGQTNFACVLGPTCYAYCNDCPNCKYAQNQIRNVLMRQNLGKQLILINNSRILVSAMSSFFNCNTMMNNTQTSEPFSCVFRHRCVKYCLDGKDCPQCYDVVKRVFTGYCYRNGFIEHYGKKCRLMFDELTKVFS